MSHSPPVVDAPRPEPFAAPRSVAGACRARWASGLLALLLAACAAVPLEGDLPPPPPPARELPPPPPPLPAPPPPAPPHGGPEQIDRERSTWRAASWDALPGWSQDRLHEAWPALLASCERPARGWALACRSALAEPPVRGPADEARVRAWLQGWLQPYRVEARGVPTGSDPGLGLITGYFEPLLLGQRKPSATHTVALHQPPAGLGQRKPWYSRSEIARVPAARAALAGREIAWLADPMDLLLVQIQGSGRIQLLDQLDPTTGRPLTVRLAYAGHNDHPYGSVGKWLVERGAFTMEQASWPAIRAWARAHPQRIPELLAANPRVVFFREEALANPDRGPLGAQGVALTPGRSIAVDKGSVPYGTPVWIATTEPQAWQPVAPPPRLLERLVVAQDTGSAIVGAVRADYFWGWGPGIEEQAGRMKQALRMWALWPRDLPLPP